MNVTAGIFSTSVTYRASSRLRSEISRTVAATSNSPAVSSGVRLISSYLDREQDKVEGPTHLRPNEGVVIKLNR